MSLTYFNAFLSAGSECHVESILLIEKQFFHVNDLSFVDIKIILKDIVFHTRLLF